MQEQKGGLCWWKDNELNVGVYWLWDASVLPNIFSIVFTNLVVPLWRMIWLAHIQVQTLRQCHLWLCLLFLCLPHGQFPGRFWVTQDLGKKLVCVFKVLHEAVHNKNHAPCFQLAPDDAWRCPHCKQLQQGSITLSLWTLPDVLIIHLKRFRQVRKSVIGKG